MEYSILNPGHSERSWGYSLSSGRRPRPKPHMLLHNDRTFELSFDSDGAQVNCICPQLLPGGRWMIAAGVDEPRMRLFCWDCLSPPIDGVLRPSAIIQGDRVAIKSSVRGLVSTQYDSTDGCVNILLSYNIPVILDMHVSFE